MNGSGFGKWAAGLGIVLTSLSAYAYDAKNYPGTVCHKVGSAGTYSTFGGTVSNSSTTSAMTVNCPLVKDAEGIFSASIEVFDRHSSQDIVCTVVDEYVAAGVFSDSLTDASSGFGSAAQTLGFGGLDDTSDSYLYAECVIPPVQNGNISHVATLHINEWD